MNDKMKTIYKYALPFGDITNVRIPKDAKVLSIQMQPGFDDPQLWALVDLEESRTELRQFRWYGTGHHCHARAEDYIATCQWQGLVFHLFEV